jgi:release factor glutamine methyltransferase
VKSRYCGPIICSIIDIERYEYDTRTSPLTMLPTPSTSHVDYSHIYEPAEDSYLLLDTLSSPSEKAFFRDHFAAFSPDGQASPSLSVLEVGTGSGVVLAFATANAAEIFGRTDVGALGTDLNPFACRATAKTSDVAIKDTRAAGGGAGVFLDSLGSDLTSALRAGSVDVLIFNPPYVPTEELPAQQILDPPSSTAMTSSARFERDSHLLALSYAGGQDGMETTNRLLEQLPQILSARGVAYVLLCAQNRPEQVIHGIRAWQGGHWLAEKVADSGMKAGWEKLCIVRIERA